MIKYVKSTKDSFQFLSRFSIDDANVALSLPRDSDSWFSSILCVFEQDFILGRNGGDDVDTWSEVVIIRGGGHLANIFQWLLFFQNVMAYITEKLFAYSWISIRYSFNPFFFFFMRNDKLIFCCIFNSQKNILFYMYKHNISFLCLISNKYLINSLENFYKNLSAS